jgi:hypothetical protein
MFASSTFVGGFSINIFILKATIFQKQACFLLIVSLDRHPGERGLAGCEGVGLRSFDKLVDRDCLRAFPSSLNVSRSTLQHVGFIAVLQALPHFVNHARQRR